jgi:hypothetical protein
VVEPTSFFRPLKKGSSSEARGPSDSSVVVDKTFASNTTGRRVCEERILTAMDSFMINSDERRSK